MNDFANLHCIAKIRAHWLQTDPFEIDNRGWEITTQQGRQRRLALLFIIPHTVLLAFIQPEAETLDFSTHALPRNL